MASGDPDRIKGGIAKARESSWESTVKKMQALITDAIGKPDRRSTKKIELLPEAKLEYVYQATQGS